MILNGNTESELANAMLTASFGSPLGVIVDGFSS